MHTKGTQAPEARARALLEKMTRKEKIGQLRQRLYGFHCYQIKDGRISFTKTFEQEVADCGGLGTLYGLFRADPWSGRHYGNGLCGEQAVKAYNQVQNYVLEHSRLRIPVMVSSECPHGHQALDGYLLPVNLAVGAAFSPQLAKEAAAVCAKQLKGMGVALALVSLLDILRDPRWGRCEECFSEDPYLASCLAGAVVESMQAQGCAVVAKHFCGQGETTGGVNASAARIGERELHEIHLPAAKACCEAGVLGIMAAYNEIDGVYCHANRQLLEGILRGAFGFSGVVMADGLAIDQLDAMTGDNVASAAAALKAGVDIGLWDDAYAKLDEAVEQGYVSEKEIDRAVLRVLKLKYALGLFDQPFIGPDGSRSAYAAQKGYFQAYAYQDYPQSQKLAEESAVLLKNKGGVLPLLDKTLKIAVIGPGADDIYRQIGDYSPPLKNRQARPEAGDTSNWQENGSEGRTLWEGLLEASEGRTLRLCDGKNLEEAQHLAKWSDVAVLALGGSSSRFEGAVFDKNGAALKSGQMGMDCGEGVDSADIRLPDGQEQLFSCVKRNGKKIVTVVIAGRPYAIPQISQDTDALLYVFYPGPMGGAAVANLLYGKKSPSGRLSASLPRSVGQLPVFYNYRNSYQAMHYYNEEDGALYAFGEGFGYSSFQVTQVEWDGIHLSCMVENTGSYEDAIVLQCYRRVSGSTTVPRVRELKAFQKLWLRSGERKKAAISIGKEFFQVYGAQGQWEEEQGHCELLLMDSGKILWRGQVGYTANRQNVQ